VISVNHPECDVCPYLWGDDSVYDMMEIWNGPMRATNMRGIQKWTKLLESGRKIPAVGGSDFHRNLSPVRLGNPVSAVYTDDPSASGILESIRSGHLFVSSSKKSPSILLRCQNKIMGDTVTLNGKTETVRIEAENLSGHKLFAVTAKGGRLLNGNEFTVDAEDQFAYVKAVKGGIIRTVTNPIYFDH
ncbi:MAG: CehA/McbA family metallohydrolase, partial [Acutalibacteraceae bacterium]